MRDRRRVQAMLQEQHQVLLQLQQQQPAGSSLPNNLLPSYGSSGALRGSTGSAGSSGKKGSRLPSPAGPGVVGSSSSSAVNCLPMELPAFPAAAEEAECMASGVGAGGVATSKHRRTDSLLAAAGKRVSASAHAAAWYTASRNR
jgi:hypothetical protein